MRLDHDTCVDAVLAGDRDDAVTEHLESCARCGVFATTVERATTAARRLLDVPPAPAGLADKVLERIAADGPGFDRRRTRPWRMRLRLLPAGLAAAAVAVLVVIAIVTPSSPRPATGQQLALVAERTVASSTAHLTLDARYVTHVSTPIGLVRTGVFTATGAGDIEFPDRLHLVYSVTSAPGSELRAAPEQVERIVVGSQAWARGPGAAWEPDTAPGGGTALTGALFRPETVLDVLRSADRDPVELGAAVRRGQAERGYRFSIPFGLFPSAFADRARPAWNVVAWVGRDDGLLHEMTLTDSGTATDPAPLTFTQSFTLRLSDFGRSVSISPPAVAGNPRPPAGRRQSGPRSPSHR